MLRTCSLWILLGIASGLLGAEAVAPVPALTATALPSPIPAGGVGASVVTAPDGTVWLSWVEQPGPGEFALRCATFDAAAKTWSEPRVIATGRDWFLNWADFPSLTVGPGGRATAVWFVNNPAPAASPASAATHDHHGPGYHAVTCSSSDAGKTWSAPVPLSTESEAVEFVALATLADGRVLAAWLDGRGKKSGGKAQRLYARIVGAGGADTLVDPSVCDCCPTALTAFIDGTALLAYRGRTEDEVRDVRLARFDGRTWGDPRPLNTDEWRIAGCPVNGPQLASDGGRVAAAWFTAADNDPRVLASISPDAGARFLIPLRLDQAKPAGRVDTVLLRDGALLVSWTTVDGAVWLRRVSPDFTASVALELAPAGSANLKSLPRLALVRDYDGGETAAQVLVTLAGEGAAGARTLLVDVPEGALLEAEKNCDCAPTAEELQGYPIRGTIVEASVGTSTVRVRHPDLPGIFAAGTREFAVAPGIAARLPAGRQFLGRIEKRNNQWRLFGVRLIAAP